MKITELQINCAHDKIVPLEELVPNPRNPNLHSPQQVEWIARVINHRGWRAPIIVSNRSGFIVCGHGRLQAAKSMKLEGVPVDFQDFESEADEWAHPPLPLVSVPPWLCSCPQDRGRHAQSRETGSNWLIPKMKPLAVFSKIYRNKLSPVCGVICNDGIKPMNMQTKGIKMKKILILFSVINFITLADLFGTEVQKNQQETVKAAYQNEASSDVPAKVSETSVRDSFGLETVAQAEIINPSFRQPSDQNAARNEQNLERLEQLMARYTRLQAGGIDSNNIWILIQLGWITFEESCKFADSLDQKIGYNLSMIILSDAGRWLMINAVNLRKGYGDSVQFGGQLVDSASGMTAWAMTVCAGAEMAGDAVMARDVVPAADERAVRKLQLDASKMRTAVHTQIGTTKQFLKLYDWTGQNIDKLYQQGYHKLWNEWKKKK